MKPSKLDWRLTVRWQPIQRREALPNSSDLSFDSRALKHLSVRDQDSTSRSSSWWERCLIKPRCTVSTVLNPTVPRTIRLRCSRSPFGSKPTCVFSSDAHRHCVDLGCSIYLRWPRDPIGRVYYLHVVLHLSDPLGMCCEFLCQLLQVEGWNCPRKHDYAVAILALDAP